MSKPDASGTRDAQAFPVLSTRQIETARRFASGAPVRSIAGDLIFDIGDRHALSWLVLDGSIEILRRDRLSGVAHVTTHGAGQLSGEVNQLAGRPSLVAGRAGARGCTALPFDAAHLRALIIGSADVGELLMRAFILRRVGLIETGDGGSVLIGVPASPDLVRLQGFLTRSALPHIVLDSAADPDGHALVERLGIMPDDLPLMVCPDGTVLRRPGDAEAARCLGLTPTLDPDAIHDVAIIGAGPAGLAASVYAASEGLSVIVLDERSVGGQAGASARIENYLGFPTGISGQALAGRAFTQALKFGAEISAPTAVESLRCPALETSEAPLILDLVGGGSIAARSVIVASGARYRRPDIASLAAFEGAGVSYWASPIEAALCADTEVALVGGGNSAGQAVVFLAPRVRRLHLIVRRPLQTTMSRYLIQRIASLPNVALHVGMQVAALEGDPTCGLTAIRVRDSAGGPEQRWAVRHLFLFIGADPNAGWIQGCVSLDGKGFVLTGNAAGPDRLPLETSLKRVFAIGDVRSGSTKRVAAAVGEGAAVIAQIHEALEPDVVHPERLTR